MSGDSIETQRVREALSGRGGPGLRDPPGRHTPKPVAGMLVGQHPGDLQTS